MAGRRGGLFYPGPLPKPKAEEEGIVADEQAEQGDVEQDDERDEEQDDEGDQGPCTLELKSCAVEPPQWASEEWRSQGGINFVEV